MKFTDLNIMQQIAITVNLAGLNVPEEEYSIFNYDDPNKIKASEEEVKLGLTYNANYFKALPIVRLRMENSSTDYEDVAVFNNSIYSGNPDIKKYLGIRFTVGDGGQVSNAVPRNRFGLVSNIFFDENLYEQLKTVTEMIKSFEELLGEDNHASEVFTKLTEATLKAHDLPSWFIEEVHVNTDVSEKLNTVYRAIMYDGILSEDDDANPIRNINFGTYPGYSEEIILYKQKDTHPDNQVRLSIKMGQYGSDIISVGAEYGRGTASKYVDYGSFKVMDNPNNKEFIMSISDNISALINNHDRGSEIQDELSEFLRIYTTLVPLTLSYIEDKNKELPDHIPF